MTFDEVLRHVLDLLQRQGRVSYRALKRRFDLDDAYGSLRALTPLTCRRPKRCLRN